MWHFPFTVPQTAGAECRKLSKIKPIKNAGSNSQRFWLILFNIILRYFFYLRINGHKACFRMSRINILIPVSTQHDSHESIRNYDTASSGWKKRKKCYWLPKYAKILKDIYQKTDEKYNSAPASHHHTQLIFLSQRMLKIAKIRTARTQHKSIAAIIPYTDDR